MSTTLKLTVDQYDRMVDRGAFEGLPGKIELLNGEICSRNPAGPVHDWLIEFLTNWSTRSTSRDKVSVRVQCGLSLPEQQSRPEPDLLWVKPRNYRSAHPTADDVLLAIEVSYSSLASDRETKQAIYSAAGIEEYWIVNAAANELHVFTDPNQSTEAYRCLRTLTTDDTVSPACAPEATLSLKELFEE